MSAPAPPIRDSKYLSKQQAIEIYRWMVLNRKMEQALENLYKQGKVVGGVYFGLGQEACSCASAYALAKDDWLAPMIRNQGALLVRGFTPRDMMMQYMAKADSPTKGRDGTSHFGDIYERNVVSPISMLGDLIPVMAGVALGARLQGRNANFRITIYRLARTVGNKNQLPRSVPVSRTLAALEIHVRRAALDGAVPQFAGRRFDKERRAE